MTQQCIRRHYEGEWKDKSDHATNLGEIAYSSPVEDAIVYPLYRQMIADLKLRVTGGDVLDIGSGSGRWIRFFLENFTPRRLTGALPQKLLRRQGVDNHSDRQTVSRVNGENVHGLHRADEGEPV